MIALKDITAATIADRRYEDKEFFEFAKEYLSACRKDRKYKKSFLNAVNYLYAFCKETSYEAYTHNLNFMVKDDFIDFLKGKDLMLSTINHLVVQLGTLINKAKSCGYSTDPTWFDDTLDDEDSNAIYLSRDEIVKLYYFEGLTRRQKEVRDLFIVGCFTGLRYSDYSRLTPSNCMNGRIKIKTQKTKAVVEIPQNKYVREVIERYGGTIPKAPCIQQFNRIIKVIAQRAGFNELVQTERTKGHNIVCKTLPKWQMVSSHTARRSAATNMYLAGVPMFNIMCVTGHKSEKAFMRYIRITQEEIVQSLAGHPFFR